MPDDPNEQGQANQLGQGNEGEPRSNVIPRDRFDEINQKYKTAEERAKELEQELSYYRSANVNQTQQNQDAGVFGDQQFAQPQQQQVQPNVYDQEARKIGYTDWNQYFQYNPNAALSLRTNVDSQLNQANQVLSVQQKWAEKKFQEKPHLRDQYKRNQDPEYTEFNRVLQENPYMKLTEAGLNQAEEIAKNRVAKRSQGTEEQRLRDQAAQEEAERQARAGAASAVQGTGSTQQVVAGARPIQLSPLEQKYAARAGLSQEEYLKQRELAKAPGGSEGKSILRNQGRARRPSVA